MKINSKQVICAFAVLFTFLTAGSLFAKDKTVGEKVDGAIEKTEKAAEATKDKAKELAHEAEEKAGEIHDKAKEKAHETVDKL